MQSPLRYLLWLVVAAFSVLAAACDGGSTRPDTGYGKDQPVPTQVSCEGLCARLSDCGGHLCAEDTGNNGYIQIFEAVNAECLASCSDATLTSQVSAEQWTCLFQSSCRQALDVDVCHVQANYHCR